MALGKDLKDSIRIATLAASIAIQKIGAQESIQYGHQ